MKNKNRLIALILCGTLGYSLFAFADETRYVKVTAYDVNIRAGASTEQPVVGRANYGDSFRVMQVQNGWYQVQLDGSKTGYIAASLVQEGSLFASSNPTLDTAEATTANLNVRGGPSTRYDVITTISPGTKYPMLQTSGDFVQIRLPDERTGWVSKSLVTLSQSKAKTIAQAERQEGTVIADVLNVRSDKSSTATILGTLRLGDLVHVLQQENGFDSIDFQGQTGYVEADFIRLSGQPATEAKQPPVESKGTTLTLTEDTNLRTGPGTNFALLKTGASGSTFPLLAKSGQWYQVALDGGQKAWVAGWLVQVHGDTSKLPDQSDSLDHSLRGKTIVLDPGHGGFDVGSIGVKGLYEKDATLALARVLYNKLLTTGANVVMTRQDDHFVSLADRVTISKQNKADVFVSLHYNTNPDAGLSGSITYDYTETGADHQLAELVQKDLVKSLGLPDLGVRFGDFYVLRENPQPAILIETSFLSNVQDEQVAQDTNDQEKAAEGIFDALVTYLSGNS